MRRFRRIVAGSLLAIALSIVQLGGAAAEPIVLTISETEIRFPPSSAQLIQPRWVVSDLKGQYYEPALGMGGTIYVGSYDPDSDGDGFMAVRPNGTVAFKKLHDAGYSDAAAAPDGTVYTVASTLGFTAMKPDGTVKWTQPEAANYKPVISPDGTIYYIKGTSIIARNPDGTAKWDYKTGEKPILRNIAITVNGTLYATTNDGKLHAVKPDGTALWVKSWQASSPFAAAVGPDGRSYSPVGTKLIQGLDASGKLTFAYTTPAFISANPVVASDGAVLVGQKDGTLQALNAKLEEKWSAKFPAQVDRIVAVSDGRIFIFSDNHVYALTKNGSAQWKAKVDYSNSYNRYGIAFAADGTVYVTGSKLFALGSPAVTGVSLSQTALSIATGSTAKLTATVLPADAVNRKVQWSSTDPSIVEVNDAGLLTAVAPGTAKAIAKSDEGGFISVCDVTVTPAIVLPPEFSDIAGHWAEPEIGKAVEKGIVKGYPDGTFKPDKSVTRAEFAVMLMHAIEPTEDVAPLTFKDKNQIPSWAADEVAQAVELGIIKGYDDGTFRPNKTINHAEMLAMVVRASNRTIPNPPPAPGYADDAEVPGWAKGTTYVARQHSLLGGTQDNKFRPLADSTRAESVTAIVRMLDIRLS